MDLVDERRRRCARLRLLPAAGVAVSLLAAAPAARAGDLTITTREHGEWNDAVAALRADLRGEGRTVHVGVRARGAALACDAYRLSLDDAARAAFRVGACDPASGETALVLVRRAALFDEGYDVPRPRTVIITAVTTTTAVAAGGLQGGSVVRCSVAVRPYLDDELHGRRVLLTPERYTLRPGSATVTVSPDPGGWSLYTADRASFRIAYEVLDRSTGEVVLRQDATLSCGPERPPSEPETPRTVEDPPPRPRPLSLPSPGPLSSMTSPPVDPGCRWGKGRKGCNASPLGLTIWAGFLTSAALTTMVGCFTASAGVDRNAGRHLGERIGGGIAVVPTVVWGAIFAGLLYDLHRDRRVKRLGFWM